MRIRNSRLPFLPPLETESSSALPFSLRIFPPDDRFLVELDSRRMGWSCYPLEKSLSKGDHELQCDKSKVTRTRELKNLDCINEGKQSQFVSIEKCYEKGKESIPCTSFERDGNISRFATIDNIVLPSSVQLGKKPTLKKRMLHYNTETEKEMAEEGKGDAITLTHERKDDRQRSKIIKRIINCQSNCPFLSVGNLKKKGNEPKEKLRNGISQSADAKRPLGPTRHEKQQNPDRKEKPRMGMKNKADNQSADRNCPIKLEEMNDPTLNMLRKGKGQSSHDNARRGEIQSRNRGRPKYLQDMLVYI